MWQHALRDWSLHLSVMGLAETTIRTYRRTVVNFLADTLLDLFTVTEDDVVSYVAALPRNGAMRGQTLRALRSFYSWAEDHERGINPVKKLKPRERKYGPAPDLEDDELVRLLVACAWREPRRAWVLMLMYATGARIGSLCAVEPEDVKGDRIHFRVAKGERPYAVPLGRAGREAAAELMAWVPPSRRHRSKGTLVGVSEERVRQWFQQAQTDAGVRVWPHLLRHAFATRIAAATDPGTWAALLNHQDLSQYRRYVATKDERLRAAVEAL